jgi:secondary thiamine-phosphate synthase enzyme
MHKITVRTHQRSEWINMTREIAQAIRESGLENGLCLIHVPHTTAGVTVNENADPDVPADLIRFLNAKIPEDWNFHHSEGNSDAHLKASLMGCSATLPVENGKLMLGTWQGIFFCEFDGPRERQVWVKMMG